MPARLAIPLTIFLACGVLAAQAWASTTSRKVSLTDNVITLKHTSAPHGTVTFKVTNNGHNTHTFNIKRVSTGKVLFASNLLHHGKQITVTEKLKAGTYRLYCTIHPGMHRKFTVS
jgi:plastocyanin